MGHSIGQGQIREWNVVTLLLHSCVTREFFSNDHLNDWKFNVDYKYPHKNRILLQLWKLDEF